MNKALVVTVGILALIIGGSFLLGGTGWVIVGMLTSLLANVLILGRGVGLLNNLLLGLTGSLLGTLLLKMLPLGGLSAAWFTNLLVGIIGALVVIAVGRTLAFRDTKTNAQIRH
jgi:uncharacterized membrane protein YeaQ/YmgE (transglycosylase-associated protein family)